MAPQCILSIDVGMVNLALCVIQRMPEGKKARVLLWQLLDVTDRNCHQNATMQPKLSCCQATKKGHCKLSCAYENVADKTQGLCQRHLKAMTESEKSKWQRLVKASVKPIREYRLQDLLYSFSKAFRCFLSENERVLSCIDKIVIEQQPVNFTKCSAISHGIMAQLVEHFDNRIPVDFVSAYHKLTVYDGPPIACPLKTQYARNKFYSKEYVKYFIEHNSLVMTDDLKGYFFQCKKQDDLSDALLQGYYFLHGGTRPTRGSSSGGTAKKKRTRKGPRFRKA